MKVFSLMTKTLRSAFTAKVHEPITLIGSFWISSPVADANPPTIVSSKDSIAAIAAEDLLAPAPVATDKDSTPAAVAVKNTAFLSTTYNSETSSQEVPATQVPVPPSPVDEEYDEDYDENYDPALAAVWFSDYKLDRRFKAWERAQKRKGVSCDTHPPAKRKADSCDAYPLAKRIRTERPPLSLVADDKKRLREDSDDDKDDDDTTLLERPVKRTRLEGEFVPTLRVEPEVPHSNNQEECQQVPVEAPSDAVTPNTALRDDAVPTTVDDATPVHTTVSDAAPSDIAPVPSDDAPSPSDAAPVPSDTAPVPSDATPAPSNAAPVPSDEAPANVVPDSAPSDTTPCTHDRVRLSVPELQQEAKEQYFSCHNQGSIEHLPIDTYQGRTSSSINGCTVISALAAAKHLQNEGTTTDADIMQVIDEQSGPVLRQCREKLGLGNYDMIIPSDVHDHLTDEGLLLQEKFVGVTGGNVMDADHLEAFLGLLSEGESGNLGACPTAATFFFQGHVISILKQVSPTGVVKSYDFIESMPKMAHNGRNVASRTVCKDISALRAMLKCYTYHKFEAPEACAIVENKEWNEYAIFMGESDPRLFQGFVWGNLPKQ